MLEDNTEPGLKLDSVRQWPKRWSLINLILYWLVNPSQDQVALWLSWVCWLKAPSLEPVTWEGYHHKSTQWEVKILRYQKHWKLDSKHISPKILSHISGAMTRMGHHPHQQKDSWNCVVRLLRYLSQRWQNQGQYIAMNSTMGVITYLDDMIVIINRTWSWVRAEEP